MCRDLSRQFSLKDAGTLDFLLAFYIRDEIGEFRLALGCIRETLCAVHGCMFFLGKI
jgi:hypothetical protein